MTETSVVSDPPSGYAAQLDALRSVAKWLVAASAGVGALLVAGLSISRIGELSPSSWRLYVAGFAAVLALATVGFMINEATIVLTHEWLTLASFGEEPTDGIVRPQQSEWRSAQLREIDDRLAVARHELFGYAAQSRSELHRRLRQADELLWQSPDSVQAVKAAREAAVLRKAARDTVQYANYYFTLKLFQRMRIRLGWAALVTAISIGVFAYAVNPPSVPQPLKVKIVSMEMRPAALQVLQDRSDTYNKMAAFGIKPLLLGIGKDSVVNVVSRYLFP